MCTGLSLETMRETYFELLNKIFSDELDPTESIETYLKKILGENTKIKDFPPQPYFMCTTTKVDIEPEQLKLVRYSTLF